MSEINPTLKKYMIPILVLFSLFIIAGYSPTPEEMEMRLPPLDSPVTWLSLLLTGIMIVYSWLCCGSDHEEDRDTEHPDGKLTYLGDKK